MEAKGHSVQTWTAQPYFYKISFPRKLRKWLGYIDQYILFPIQVKRKIKKLPKDTLFVFSDHALGPWVPLVANRPHIVHCHDFLAQRSALGEIPGNPTGWSGRKYQLYIRKGYRKCKNFISVSNNTREDLHRFLEYKPECSEVIYNGINPVYKPFDVQQARINIGKRTGFLLDNGYLLHVGGNYWYKNRKGVIEIYNKWRLYTTHSNPLPLIMIGKPPDSALKKVYNASLFKNDIHFLSNINDEYLRYAYSGATVFLFPSFDEGFGWPIAEAMACGCSVVTINQDPMREVACDAAFLIECPPVDKKEKDSWSSEAAKVIETIVQLSPEAYEEVSRKGIENVKRFNGDLILDEMESLYLSVLAKK